MLIRISLIVAIVVGLAVGVLNFVYVKEKITTLQTNDKDGDDGCIKEFRGQIYQHQEGSGQDERPS